MTHLRRVKEDLRVRRTRKSLQNALIELSAQKGFAHVTVQDIAEFAMVNRATFYRYYLDKYDLLDKYMDEQYALLEAAEHAGSVEEKLARGTAQAPVGLVRLLEHISTHADFFRAMLSEKGDPAFARKIQHYIEKRLRSLLPAIDENSRKGHPQRSPIDLCLSYMSSASLGMIVWWLENNMPYTPDQIATWSIQFSTADLKVALQTEPD